MSLESETGGPDRDYTRYLWLGVAILLALMVAGLYAWSQPEPVESVARARHILISANMQDEAARVAAYEQALDVLRQLREGEEFARLARQYSSDPGTKDTGGDLGYAPKGVYQDAFDAYVWSAPVRQISAEPVRTGFGYHIIEVLDRRYTEIDRYEIEIGQEAVDRLEEEDAEPEAEN